MFKHPLTILDEYWLGYFRADGCISRTDKYRKAIFAQVEIEPVMEFANYIGKPNLVRICHKPTRFGDSIYHIVVSSEVGYLLDNLGAKTQLYEPLYKSKHFWRGLCDGDGSIVHQSNKSRIEWCGTQYDMEMCSNFLEPYLDFRPTIHSFKTIFRVALNDNRAKFITHLLYEDEYSAFPKKRNRANLIISLPYKTGTRAWLPNSNPRA